MSILVLYLIYTQLLSDDWLSDDFYTYDYDYCYMEDEIKGELNNDNDKKQHNTCRR